MFPNPKKKKKLLLYLVHGFDDIHSKLETKCLNRLAKLQFIQFFACAEGSETKYQNFKIQLPTPINHSMKFFVYLCSLHAAHV